MEKKTRNEIILVGGLIVFILLLFLAGRLRFGTSAIEAEVSVDGQVIAAYGLDENVDIIINGYNGGTNHLIIKDGGASITEASCPDKICVRQGIIKEAGQSLVCLPNKVIVTLK